ncbi:helix-turn-helix transcriptional regulator [Trinickia acidisoli]|uniref:helix-turn-helix transcriptional regulator n=1 Tax=Trinickia acidisoli TaxID=2767482 RepID=UPI001A8E8A75|nr:LuxR family transcriptional regulator [Trinickia acidisoli]
MNQYGTTDADTDVSNFLVYGDAELDSTADAPIDDDAPDGQRLAGIAHDLAKVGSAQARHALLRPALRAAGFESLCYMRVSRIGDTINRLVYFNAFSPTGWAQRYLRERFYDIDARLAYSCRHEWPMLWDLSSISSAAAVAGMSQNGGATNTTAAARTERFATAARDAGMLSGVSFGLGTPDALDTCVVMFASSQQSKARLPDMAIGHAYALAVGLHEFLALRAPQIHRPAYTTELSDIQRSILELVTLGMNDKDIAERLGTSHHNVDYYLRQLKKLYHATNRVQLAYIAGRVLGTPDACRGANS